MNRLLKLVMAAAVIFGAAFMIERAVVPAQASSVARFIVGDTISLVKKVAHDTLFKSTYDCCEFFYTSDVDTTRWLNITGATEVRIRPIAADTATAFRWTYTVQFTNDTTKTPQTTASTAKAGIDSVGLSTGTTQSLLYANTNGSSRYLTMRPIAGANFDVEAGGLGSPMHLTGWIRVIVTRVYTDVVTIQGLYVHKLRVETYVERDDLGEDWMQSGIAKPR